MSLSSWAKEVPSVATFESASNNLQFDPSVTHKLKEDTSITSQTTELPANILNMCLSALEDATDQLKTLGSGLFPAANIDIKGIEERAKKYCTEDPVFDPQSGDTFEKNLNEKKFRKLYHDSSKIEELLTEIKNELRYDKEYSTLTNYIELTLNAKKEDEQLLADEIKNMALMDSLKQTLYNEQKGRVKEIQKINERIAILKDEREDAMYENLIRKRYIESWEKARMSQNKYAYMLSEKKLENTIDKYRNEIAKEERANHEIKLFIRENQTDMLNAIKYWMSKYDKDSESRRHETEIYKDKRIELRKEYVALKEMYDLREKQINDYLDFKEKKRREAEIIAFTNGIATKLQAWWRGTMVRRKLGKFDPHYMEKQIARNAAAKDKKNKNKKNKDKKGKKK